MGSFAMLRRTTISNLVILFAGSIGLCEVLAHKGYGDSVWAVSGSVVIMMLSMFCMLPSMFSIAERREKSVGGMWISVGQEAFHFVSSLQLAVTFYIIFFFYSVDDEGRSN